MGKARRTSPGTANAGRLPTPVRAGLAVVALLGTAMQADAANSPAGSPMLRLAAPAELAVGQRATLDVTLDLPSQVAEPLLLTAHAEGEALEVVRGRLMRSDARAPASSPLHFDIPVLARSPGTSIVRVHALVFLCEAKQAAECQALELEARASVAVLPR